MSDVWYLNPGVDSGYYHYATSFLRELSVDAECFYVGPMDGDFFPVRESPLVVMADSRGEAVMRSVKSVITFALRLLTDPPKTVHVNAVVFSEFFTALLLLGARLRGIHTVWTIHEVPGDRHGSGPSVFWRAALHIADELIVHHEEMANRIDQSAVVIPHGNYLLFDELSGEVESDRETVLFLGDSHYKGIDLFLDAVDRLQSSPEIVVLGDVEHDDVASIDEFLSGEELATWFKRADVVALPYRGGQTSGGLHIALATGNSVVVPDRPMFTDVLPDDYPTVELSPEAIAQEIDRQITEEDYRRDLVEVGEGIAHSDEYSWKTITRRTEQHYATN